MSRGTTCIVQARTSSSRLPGKVLADLGGLPMLGFMLRRLEGLAVDAVVVATSVDAEDDAVVDVASRFGAATTRGPLDDVLARFALALDEHPGDVVVRLTADCPLVDPRLVEAVVAQQRASGSDLVSNTLVRTHPDGLDVEVLSARALRAAAVEAVDRAEREHVTPFVSRRPGRFRLEALREPLDRSHHRWTVDTADDLDLVRGIVAALDDPVRAGWSDILQVAPPPPRRPAVHLRTAEPGDDVAHLRPIDDPGRRSWTVVDRDRKVGWLHLPVSDGVARLEVSPDLPPVLAAPAVRDLHRLMGSQVAMLVADASIARHGELAELGYEAAGGTVVWRRS